MLANCVVDVALIRVCVCACTRVSLYTSKNVQRQPLLRRACITTQSHDCGLVPAKEREMRGDESR